MCLDDIAIEQPTWTFLDENDHRELDQFAFRGARFAAQLAQELEDQETQAEIGKIEVEPLPEIDLGDQSEGIRISSSFSVSGFDLPFVFEFQLVRLVRAAIDVMLGAVGPDDPTADREELLRVLVDEVEPNV
jgi:hypothetical protein